MIDTIRYFDKVYKGSHYLDFPAENAPTYLKRMLGNYRTATWVGDLESGIMETNLREIVSDPLPADSYVLLMVSSLGDQNCDEHYSKTSTGQATAFGEMIGNGTVLRLLTD